MGRSKEQPYSFLTAPRRLLFGERNPRDDEAAVRRRSAQFKSAILVAGPLRPHLDPMGVERLSFWDRYWNQTP